MQVLNDLVEIANGQQNNELGRNIARNFITADMPFFWTSLDTRRGLIAGAIPASIGLANILSARPGKPYHEFLKTSLTPKWFSDCAQFHGVLDVATLSPLGFASYIVYKYGGGFDYTDTTIALGLYGLDIAFTVAPLFCFPKRDYQCLAVTKSLAFCAGLATFVAFRSIDAHAGWYVLPYTIWTAFWAYASYKMMKANSTVNA